MKIINEDLYVSDFILDVLYQMKSKSIVAKVLLSFLSYGYDTNSEINFLDIGDTLSMIKYMPSQNIDGSNVYSYNQYMNAVHNPKLVNAKIGRVVRKIISKLNLDKVFKFEGVSNKYTIEYSKYYDNNYLILNMSSEYYNEYYKFQDQIFNDEYHILLKFNKKYVLETSNFKFVGQLITDYGISRHNNFDIKFIIYDNVNELKEILKKNTENLTFSISYSRNLKITDKDIEDFVNEYQSLVSYNYDDTYKKIEIVKGEDIKKWYDSSNYKSVVGGSLSSSCMNNKPSTYFDIYSKNSNVSLLILTDMENKLVGRALLWELKDGKYFMDRIYYLKDSIASIFSKYAIDNNYIYRNNSVDIKYYFDGKEIDEPNIRVILDNGKFTYYPYLDTLKFIDGNILSNEHIGPNERIAQSVDGFII